MEICRLCLLNQNQSINIFTRNVPNKNVSKIIGKHIGEVFLMIYFRYYFQLINCKLFKVSELDPLPKHICLECWTKVDQFHEFHERIHAAQANYLNQLAKYERENNFIAVSEPVNLNSDPPAIEGFIAVQNVEDNIKIEYESGKSDATMFTYDDVEKIPDSEEPLERYDGFGGDDNKISDFTEGENDSGKKTVDLFYLF